MELWKRREAAVLNRKRVTMALHSTMISTVENIRYTLPTLVKNGKIQNCSIKVKNQLRKAKFVWLKQILASPGPGKAKFFGPNDILDPLLNWWGIETKKSPSGIDDIHVHYFRLKLSFHHMEKVLDAVTSLIIIKIELDRMGLCLDRVGFVDLLCQFQCCLPHKQTAESTLFHRWSMHGIRQGSTNTQRWRITHKCSVSYLAEAIFFVPTPLEGGGTMYSNGIFFVQTISADRYIRRRDLRLVSLESSSSVEYGI